MNIQHREYTKLIDNLKNCSCIDMDIINLSKDKKINNDKFIEIITEIFNYIYLMNGENCKLIKNNTKRIVDLEKLLEYYDHNMEQTEVVIKFFDKIQHDNKNNIITINDLKDNINNLKDSINHLKNGMQNLKDGVNNLKDNVNYLEDNINNSIYDIKNEIKNETKSNLKKLEEKLNFLDILSQEYNEKIKKTSELSKKYDEKIFESSNKYNNTKYVLMLNNIYMVLSLFIFILYYNNISINDIYNIIKKI